MDTSVDDSFERAVTIALDPAVDPALKQQATQFYDSVRLSGEGWLVALRVFLKNSTPEVRFHGLTVLEDLLRTRYTSLSPQHRSYLRQSLWQYLVSSITTNPPSPPTTTPASSAPQQQKPSLITDPIFLRSKYCLILVLLFRHQYPQEWPSFFEDLIALLGSASQPVNGTGGVVQTSGNVQWETMVDVFLRVCLAVDDEIVRLDVVRGVDDLTRNGRVKDVMREGDTARLTTTWFQILSTTHATIPTLTPPILQLYARYVSWIDISLVVSPTFMQALYSFLPVPATRTAAIECLTEIVGKGMKPNDKMGLVGVLRVEGVLEGVRGEVEGDPEFGETVAKFVNILGVEVGRVWEESSEPEIKKQAMECLGKVFPYFLSLLGNEYDDTTRVIFPFLEKWLKILKEVKRQGGKGGGLAEFEGQIVEVLRVVVLKLKWEEDSEWGFAEDEGVAGVGEGDGEFLEMRKQLKVYFDALSTLSPPLFISHISSYVLSTFSSLNAKAWTEVELALQLMYWFSEALFPVYGSPIFSDMPERNVKRADEAFVVPLEGMLRACLEADVASYPHASIPYAYFDNVSRYTGFFEAHPEFVGNILGVFVDGRYVLFSSFLGDLETPEIETGVSMFYFWNRGLHHPKRAVRSRVYYHFLRFVEKAKGKLVPFVESILSQIQDILLVSPPDPSTLPTIDSQTSSGSASGSQLNLIPSGAIGSMEGQTLRMASPFDSQLYLFESVGVLISCLDEGKGVGILGAVVTPLMRQLEEIMTKELWKQDAVGGRLVYTTQLNYIVRAIGGISKGFPEYKTTVNAPVRPFWTTLFKSALQEIIAVLEQLNHSELIREACRYTFQRMVGSCGPEVMDAVRPLLGAGLLRSGTRREVGEFLGFGGLVVHRFGAELETVFNDMFAPLMDRIFYYLNLPAEGTDDEREMVELKKMYLIFLSQLLGGGLDGVLISDANMPRLDTITRSVLHYASDSSVPEVQKAAFALLAKMVSVWGGVAAKSAKQSTTLPPNTAPTNGINGSLKKKGLVGQPKPPQQNPTPAPPSTPTESIPPKIPGFDTFILSSIVPLLFSVPLQPTFNLRDPSFLAVIGEIGGVHK
ncbi:pre-tRNA nuclear export protein, partial [Rhizophlyctis rosea]